MLTGITYFLSDVYAHYNRAYAPWSSFYPLPKSANGKFSAIDLEPYRINMSDDADVSRSRYISDDIFGTLSSCLMICSRTQRTF